MKLDQYQALSFDCYGTLIDWETGILNALRQWTKSTDIKASDEELIRLFGLHETQVQSETPSLPYPQILTETHRRIAASLGFDSTKDASITFGKSVGDWPVFDDTVAALQKLATRYKLIILSNVDRESFAISEKKLGVKFDRIITAEDVGSYKPDLRNFKHLVAIVQEMGIAKDELLHVGESINHDVVPAAKMKIDSAWIDRQMHNPEAIRASGAIPEDIKPTMVFENMAAFARTIEALTVKS
jgi:2-haloalkanoic acid dehalogenase type II